MNRDQVTPAMTNPTPFPAGAREEIAQAPSPAEAGEGASSCKRDGSVATMGLGGYGMGKKANALAFLPDFNLQLAAAEAAGKAIVGPGLPPSAPKSGLVTAAALRLSAMLPVAA
jgi:hypothetical protein